MSDLWVILTVVGLIVAAILSGYLFIRCIVEFSHSDDYDTWLRKVFLFWRKG